MMCSVLKISRSCYYNWKQHPESKREKRKTGIKSQIQGVYFEFKGRYGSPLIAKELSVRGVSVSETTVSKHMQSMGLKSKLSRKYKVTTDSNHNQPVACNLLNREFYSSRPGVKCVPDITYLSTTEGSMYLTTIIDLLDRKVIGWHLSDSMKAQDTIIPSLQKAVKNRKLEENMLFHSDRGTQYACKATVNVLQPYHFCQSMSRKGNCWDNAVAESFFKSLKTELGYGQKLVSKKQMKLDIFEYIETYYNKNRRQSYLNFQTMDEFWKIYETDNHFINPAA